MKRALLLITAFVLLSTCLFSCSLTEYDLSLTSITVAGVEIEGVSPDVLEYEMYYDPAMGVPGASKISCTTADPKAKTTVFVSNGVAKISVFDPSMKNKKEYKITMKVMEGVASSAEIVNKNGAKGVLTLISDDGDPRTSDFFYTVVAPQYDAFKVTIALPTKNVASLSTTADGKAYLMDDNGNYVLTVKDNAYASKIAGSPFTSGAYATMVDFWKKATDNGHIAIASHSHSHGSNWGYNDEIGYNQNGSVKYPAGSVLKELRASAQILRDLIGQDTPFIMRPGGTFWNDADSAYFYNLVETDGTFIGMRTSNGAAPFLGATSANGAKLNTPEKFKTVDGRLKIATILVRGYEAAFDETGKAFETTSASTGAECIAAGVSAWEQYVDYAMQYGSWASLGFHSVVADNVQGSGYQVYDSQVLALMDYVQPLVESGDLWLPTFDEAAKYYFQWSSAEVSAVTHGTDRVEITLTDKEDDPRFDEELTVKVTVPSGWTSAELDSYGVKTELEIHTEEDGTHFVYANVLPGDGVSTVREK